MITYKDIRNIDIESLRNLYTDAGWYAYTNNLDSLVEGIKHSTHVYSAWDNDVLVGLIRAVGDGHTIVYIQDILVLNSHKRQKVATNLLHIFMNQCNGVRQIVLITDDSVSSNAFYQSQGFLKLEATGGQGYIIYNQ